VLAHADKYCGHVFDLLGSGDVNLGPDIDWHADCKTGFTWNKRTYFSDIKIPYGKADIKIPWELSRFSHAVTLGQAYRLTGDEKYAREFASQVSDWIDSNKPEFGVNWSCTMDVAIRACNWIAAYALFHDSPTFDNAFLIKFLKSLYQHGLHIRANLEYSEALTSNHYLANIAGLAYLGAVFPEFREAGDWKTFAEQELVREMEKQVYPDGCDFEASTCYHRLVLELFFFPTLVSVVNDERYTGSNHADVCRNIFGAAYTDRLRKMFTAVLHLLKPNGMMPQVGDNDSGRLHIFADRDILDMRYLLTLGAVFFKEPRFKVKEFGFSAEALWVFGNGGHDIWNRFPERPLADIESIAFPDTGWYIMRKSNDYLMISCGSNGQKGNGGHAHNDKLAFELCLEGEAAIVDPGTGVYTPDPSVRNIFRSTASHATVRVDGQEQNTIRPGLLFLLQDDTRARMLAWSTGTDEDVFIGEHQGYTKLGSPVVHRREIRFRKRSRTWDIADHFSGSGTHTLEWNFVLAPGADRKIQIASETLCPRQETTPYSPGYGIMRTTTKLSCSLEATLPYTCSFVIRSRKEELP